MKRNSTILFVTVITDNPFQLNNNREVPAYCLVLACNF